MNRSLHVNYFDISDKLWTKLLIYLSNFRAYIADNLTEIYANLNINV